MMDAAEEDAVKEAPIQKVILDYLAAKRILAFRMNSGVLRNAANRPVTFGVPGMADILAFPWQPCILHDLNSFGDLAKVKALVPTWIECKATKGKQTELQKSFQAQVEEHGHRYIVAKSLDDVIAAL